MTDQTQDLPDDDDVQGHKRVEAWQPEDMSVAAPAGVMARAAGDEGEDVEGHLLRQVGEDDPEGGRRPRADGDDGAPSAVRS